MNLIQLLRTGEFLRFFGRSMGNLFVSGAVALVAACAAAPGESASEKLDPAWTSPPPYLLRPGDEVEVKFYYSPQMNEREVIRPDGQLTLPYLPHNVVAANLSIEQLRANLVKAYEPFMVNPNIEVVLRTASANRVFVVGEVTTENAIIVTGPMTVSRAITMSEGLKPTAAKSSVLVMRRTPTGKKIVRRVNYNHIVDGSDMSQDIVLAAGDTVFVPQTWIGDLDDFVTTFRLALPVNTGISANYSFGTHDRSNNGNTTTTTVVTPAAGP